MAGVDPDEGPGPDRNLARNRDRLSVLLHHRSLLEVELERTALREPWSTSRMTARHRRSAPWRSSQFGQEDEALFREGASSFPDRHATAGRLPPPRRTVPVRQARGELARRGRGTAPSRHHPGSDVALPAPAALHRGRRSPHLLPLGGLPALSLPPRGRRRTSGRANEPRGILACPAPGHPWPSGLFVTPSAARGR